MERKEDLVERAAVHWSKFESTPKRRHWWHSQRVMRHVNKKLCGEEFSTLASGEMHLLRTLFPGRCFSRGVSIGCGTAGKEFSLLREGIVNHFDLYEIAEVRCREIEARAENLGLLDKITLHQSTHDFTEGESKYDLVYWSSSLHHMPDTFAAIAWSYHALNSNGVFFLNDYTGPNYNQWHGAELDAIHALRESLPVKYMTKENGEIAPAALQPHSVERWLKMDPSEAADSEAILPALKQWFPYMELRSLGGVLYFIALNDIFHNFDDVKDADMLDAILLADSLLAAAGHSYYTAGACVRN